MTVTLIILVAVLAFANGANDNGKGVATLVGFGAARPQRALFFATSATLLGGITSFFLAGGLLKGFSGNWLFASGIVLNQTFYVAVLIGACGWVLLANQTGMPVSTTHAIVGSLCGAGLVSFGNAKFQWGMLGQRFAVPLAISPVLSLGLVYLLCWPLIAILRSMGSVRAVSQRGLMGDDRFGVSDAKMLRQPIDSLHASSAPDNTSGGTVVLDYESVVAPRVSPVATAIHWFSGGLISFARGWNDTPKIAALSVLALSQTAHGTAIGFTIVAVAMAVGGLTKGRRVLETLSTKLTPLPLAESLTASLVTGVLVSLASWIALPVSTTHVATGAIIGAGLKNDPKAVKWAKVGEVILSWIITLPVAALIAAIAKWMLH